MAQRKRNRRRKKPVLTPNKPLVKYGLISFNSIGWGNPTINQHLTMKEKGELDDLLPDLYKNPFPPNESDETLSELKYIKTKLARLKNKETYEECTAIDVNLGKYLNTICENAEIYGIYDLIIDVDEKVLDSIILKTKYHYNRPRPSQLSFYFINQEELNPLKSCSAMTPAYPSGHSLIALVICDILAHHFPEHKEMFNTIQRRVAISRIIIGVHYPSDNEFSSEIAKKIISHPKMRELYYDKPWEPLINEVDRDVPE